MSLEREVVLNRCLKVTQQKLVTLHITGMKAMQRDLTQLSSIMLAFEVRARKMGKMGRYREQAAHK